MADYKPSTKEIKAQMKEWADVEEQRAINRNDASAIVRFVSEKNYPFQLKFFLNASFPYLSDAQRHWIYDIYYLKFLEVDQDQWVKEPDPKTKRERSARDWPAGGTGGLSANAFRPMLEHLFQTETKEDPENFAHSKYGHETFTKQQWSQEFSKIDSTKDGNVSLLEFLLWRTNEYIFGGREDIVEVICQQQQFIVDGSAIQIVEAQKRLDDVKEKWNGIDSEQKKLEVKAADPAGGVKASQAKNKLKQHKLQFPDLDRNSDFSNAEKKVRQAIQKARQSKHCAKGNEWFLAKEQMEIKLRKSQKAQTQA